MSKGQRPSASGALWIFSARTALLYVPADLPGFLTLQPSTTVFYKVDNVYSARNTKRGCVDDTALGIPWPLRCPGICPKRMRARVDRGIRRLVIGNMTLRALVTEDVGYRLCASPHLIGEATSTFETSTH